MIAKFKIDPTKLIASIYLENGSYRVINEIKLLMSSLSDDYTFQDDTFTIPWFELRRGISDIAFILKREKIQADFDDLTTTLIKEAIQDKRSIKERNSLSTPSSEEFNKYLQESGFVRVLKKEQTRDALKLLSINHGANFSVPGAGKTTTILAVHTILKKLNVVNKLFIIAPINAFISWEDEITEIFYNRKQNIRRLSANDLSNFTDIGKENPDIILVNYEKLRKNISGLIPFFIRHKVHLILDESHRIKSGTNNLSYNQIIKLGNLAKRRDILSGTPMPQNYLDLVPQFDYLWPGEDIIPQSNLNEKEGNSTVNFFINDLYVRTTKNELGLRNPNIYYTTIPMGKVQSELYNLFKSETARILSGMDRTNIQDFRRIGKSVVKLLQAATNPMLLSLKDEYENETVPIPIDKEYWELLYDFRKYVSLQFSKSNTYPWHSTNMQQISFNNSGNQAG